MVKVLVQQLQEKAKKLAPNNNTSSRKENILLFCDTTYSTYCMSQHMSSRVQQKNSNSGPLERATVAYCKIIGQNENTFVHASHEVQYWGQEGIILQIS